MRVSELKAGMLLRPKQGCIFRLYRGYAAGTEPYQQLECHSRFNSDRPLGVSPVIYVGIQPKTDMGAKSYESRRMVFASAVGTGVKIRVAPEAWRNMEAIINE